MSIESILQTVINTQNIDHGIQLAKQGDKKGKQLMALLKHTLHQANWQQNPVLNSLVDKTVVALGSYKKQKSKLKKINKKIATLQQPSVASAVKPLEKDYLVETIAIPGKAIHAKAAVVHSKSSNVKKHFKKWNKQKSKQDFGSYIAKHASSSDKRAMQKKNIRYLTPEEAQKYKAAFVGGKLFQKGKTMKNGEYIYVLNQTGTDLFVGRKERGSFHHSSFLAGAPVLCAGECEMKDGRIKSMNLSSGHYKPAKLQAKALLAYLQDPSRLGDEAKKLKIKMPK